MPNEAVRTTLTIPAEVLTAIDQEVASGRVASRSELVSIAVQHELAARQRDAIDAAFCMMATDEEYVAESAVLQREFATADQESLALVERAAMSGHERPCVAVIYTMRNSTR